MIQSTNQTERHTLPRWNSLENATKLGELSSSRVPKIEPTHSSEHDIASLLRQWKTEQNLPLAVEIISASKFSPEQKDISDVMDYAQNAIGQIKDSNPLLAELLLDNPASIPSQAMTHQVYVEQIKKKLIEHPRNPLLWNELSREYTILGLERKSAKAIQVAFGLAPESRIILRSIARFHTHIGDPEQALYYLRKSRLLTCDPWVLSAEIALSNEMERSSKNVKLGQSMLSDANFHPLALSELASELGTMDFFAGKSKQGKRKFELATLNPHENAVAQIAWVDKHAYNVSSIIDFVPDTHCNFEAEANRHLYSQDWNNTLNYAGLWQEYQPFSREPAMLSSFIATDFLQDYTKAHQTLSLALTSNPNDSGLLNNYAYLLILTGDLNRAEIELDRASKAPDSHDSIPLLATSGLLHYRKGNPDLGRSLYISAIHAAKKEQQVDFLYRALLCLAREEKRCGNSINDLIAQIEDPKYSVLRKQYDTLVTNFGLE